MSSSNPISYDSNGHYPCWPLNSGIQLKITPTRTCDLIAELF